jgi:CBS domain-containing protein
MEAARLMRDEDTGNIPVVDGESLSARSEPNPFAVDGQQNLDGLRLMLAKVVEVISK